MVQDFNVEKFILYCEEKFNGFDNSLMRSIIKNAIGLIKEIYKSSDVEDFIQCVTLLCDFELEDEEVEAFFDDRENPAY